MTLCLHSKRILLLLCLQDTCTSSASPLLPKTSLADIQKVKKPLILSKLLIENGSQGFGEAIAASMFSAPGLVRTTAAPTLQTTIILALESVGSSSNPSYYYNFSLGISWQQLQPFKLPHLPLSSKQAIIYRILHPF